MSGNAEKGIFKMDALPDRYPIHDVIKL